MAAADFPQLMRELQEGSDAAAMQLIELYGPHVCRVVRRRLARELRPRFDSGDFVQAVWASFFANRDRVAEFESPGRLVAYLAGIASKKVIDEVRRRMMHQRENIHREVRLAEFSRESAAPGANLPGREATPSQYAVAEEQRENLFLDQPSHHRKIVEMRLEGSRFVEIAKKLGVAERTVRRVMDKLSKRVRRCRPN
jgi:RNA polymerase sigma-70 factor (ECF subfamily)